MKDFNLDNMSDEELKKALDESSFPEEEKVNIDDDDSSSIIEIKDIEDTKELSREEKRQRQAELKVQRKNDRELLKQRKKNRKEAIKNNIEIKRVEAPFDKGLTNEEFEERMSLNLCNRTKKKTSKSLGKIFVSNICTFFNFLIFFLAALLIFVNAYLDLTFLLIAVCNIIIGIIQEIRAKNMIDKLSLMTSPTASVVRDSEEHEISTADIATPVTYTVTGGETAIHQSRSTFVGGTLKSVTSSGTKWTSDTDVVITVNGVDINCFAKAKAFTTEQGAAIEAKLSKSITFKGFTGWYNGFQVQLTEVVATGTYTLEQFVSDFLTKTAAVCGEAWVPGSNHKTELQTQVWNYLNSESKYQAMSDEDKATLRTHVIVKDSTDLDRALERYEFLVGKYELGNFLERSLGSGSNSFNLVAQNNNVLAVVAVTSVITIISLAGLFLVIRKRKHQ